ncbi:MAG: hypothetical protein SF029_07390 [bacterium]|nr:hypothetical protein [bacterium]
MDGIAEGLTQIKTRYNDIDWLSENTARIYETITSAASQEDTASEAYDTLLLVYPYVLTAGDVKKWGKMIHDVLNTAMKQYVRQNSQVTWNTLGATYMTSGASKSPETAIAKPVRRATRRQNPRAILDAYIGLLKLQVYRQTTQFSEELIKGALDLARQVNHPQLYARLYQALAYAYAFWGSYEKAIDQGQLAYSYWMRTGNHHEAGFSAYIIAVSHRFQNQTSEALRWLELTSHHFSKTDNAKQHALVAVETGSLYLMQGRWEAAEQWYQITLDEGKRANDRYTIALAQHSLGIAQTFQDKFTQAEANLGASLAYWQELNDPRQLAHLHHTLAYLEGKRRNFEAGLQHLNTADKIAALLPESDFKAFLAGKVAELRKALQIGTLPEMKF